MVRPHLLLALALLVIATLAPPLGAQARPAPAAPAGDGWQGHAVVPGRLLVGFAGDTPPSLRRQVHAALGRSRARTLWRGTELVEVQGQDLPAALAAYRARPEVAWAEPDVLIEQAGTPDDPQWTYQWNLLQVGAPQLWEQVRGDPSIVVAVIDSGVRTDHVDLAAHLAWGRDTFDGDDDPSDAHGHGTHCAGIAAAVTDNGLGIAGAAHGCRFASYRCGDASFPTSALVEAIGDAVDRGAQVLSMSWASTYNSVAIQTALVEARDAGCVLVAAAGNADSTTPHYPAALSTVLAVASSAPDDSRSPFSNHGSWVDVAAPGQSIYSTWKSGGYTWMSGTSMATPLVAGQAALLYSALGQARSQAGAARVRAAIEDSALDVGSWVRHGRVDFPASLTRLAASAPPHPQTLEPAVAQAFAESTVLLRGSGLLGVDRVEVGGHPAAFTVHDDSHLSFALPWLPALGIHAVSVREGGSSGLALPLEVQATSPPRLRAPLSVAVGGTLTWEFGGIPGEHWVLVGAASPDTVLLHGWPVLADFTLLALGRHAADGAGLGSLEAVVPPGVQGLTVHSQILAGPGWFASASTVVGTTVTP